MSSAFLCPVGKRLLFYKSQILKHMKTINFLKTALLTIALFVCGNVGAETATLQITNTTTFDSSNPQLTQDGVSWIATTANGEITSSYQDYYLGQQFGSGSTPWTGSFSTNDITGTISKIEVGANTGGSATLSVTVGGNPFGENNTVTKEPNSFGTYAFEGNSTGEIIISVSNTSKAFYLNNIKVTFSAIVPTESYTVTFDAGTGTCETTSLTETTPSAGITLPTATSPCPENWTFIGWAKENVAETTTAPTLFSANSEYKPTAHETLYAVYTQEEEGQNPNEFKLSLIYEENTYYISETITSKKLEAVTSVDNAAILA